jgi:hypothetical protein
VQKSLADTVPLMETSVSQDLLTEFVNNVAHNLFKPLLLFFYLGFLIPLLKVKFEFPKVLYQGITMYLLIAIGWHGGEELAKVAQENPAVFAQAGGFMVVGFITNTVIGLLAYVFLRKLTNLRKIDAATVAGYYGSDSAGTFVTCMGVLAATSIAAAPYMPVMLAVMEVPGCLVALFLVSTLRHRGMDTNGNMPGEEGYAAAKQGQLEVVTVRTAPRYHEEENEESEEVVSVGAQGGSAATRAGSSRGASGHGLPEEPGHGANGIGHHGHGEHNGHVAHIPTTAKPPGFLSRKVLHEVFLNPGLYLLFGGILIGFISRLQGTSVVAKDDQVFVTLFEGVLCLFLLEMGITACTRLRDLRKAGWRFIAFGLLAPNVFATTGICIAHLYSHALGVPLQLGTYVLFAVLCGAASYIAVPAVQRMAIPEASPTLPLAASLGLTFSYNVTIGIPVYIMLSKVITTAWPVIA